MNIANIKLPIAVIGVIVAQAFGIIWYVAQLDSTVKTLDYNMSEMQSSIADTSIAVIETDLVNIKKQIEKLGDIDKFDPTNIWEAIDDFDGRLDEIEKMQAIIENEMRTIMTDHKGFADVLAELQKSGILPTGEKRQYGNYGD